MEFDSGKKSGWSEGDHVVLGLQKAMMENSAQDLSCQGGVMEDMVKLRQRLRALKGLSESYAKIDFSPMALSLLEEMERQAEEQMIEPVGML